MADQIKVMKVQFCG